MFVDKKPKRFLVVSKKYCIITLMKQQKFSKKITIIMGVLMLLIGISIGGYLVLKSRSGQAVFLEELTKKINNQEIADDFDNDGLAEWEEKIHQTDSNNPDTDGDGYLDGEEVAAGYDPTRPAPNDKLANNDRPNQSVRPEPGNLTQLLTYVLSNQMRFDPPTLANIKDVGSLEQLLAQTADERVTKALQKASAGFLSEFIPPFEKKATKLKTTPNNDLKSIQDYAGQVSQKIGPLDSCQTINNLKEESEIIQESIETNNFNQVNCLANTYLQAYQQLLLLPVPLDWIDIHKKILSVCWTLHKIYHYLPDYEKDPLKGFLVIEKFKEVNQEFINLFETMAADLESR
jgi:hypothetical protein